jgi:hypothetical protein
MLPTRIRNRIRSCLLVLAMVALFVLTGCVGTSIPPQEAPADLQLLLAAKIAVNTGNPVGFKWDIDEPAGTTITVYRDNPPLMGLLTVPQGGSILRTPTNATPYNVTSYLTQPFVWNGMDFRIAGSEGATFLDQLNTDGYLGITHLGGLPSASQSFPSALHWHTNGLQLVPGQPAHLQLQRRVFVSGSWTWQDVPDVHATLNLDPNTVIDAVEVIVVHAPGQPATHTDRALAQLWFEGRTVSRLGTSVSDSPALNAFLADHDPRASWSLTTDNMNDADQGRESSNLLAQQDPDAIWCQCAVTQCNIQFRLVRYEEVSSDVAPGCGMAGSVYFEGSYESCVNAWARYVQAHSNTVYAHPIIPIVVLSRYPERGVAQTWPEGIVMGEGDLSRSAYPNAVLAHELGHYRGFSGVTEDPQFADGFGGIGNLMTSSGTVLTVGQCSVAYTNAQAYAFQ